MIMENNPDVAGDGRGFGSPHAFRVFPSWARSVQRASAIIDGEYVLNLTVDEIEASQQAGPGHGRYGRCRDDGRIGSQ
jgi:hypothetical protein